MKLSRRIVALGLTAAVVVTACGGDDDSAPVAEPPATEAPDGSADDGTTGDDTTGDDNTETTDDTTPVVVPTIAPDLPDDFVEGTGAVAVVGDPLPAYPVEGADPAIGETAPILVGETFDGDLVTIDATVDGPTWIVFLAHWCPYCNDEIPVINQLRDEGRIPDGVNVVGVSTAFRPDRPNWPPGEWLDDLDWTFTAIPDGIDMQSETNPYIAAGGFGIGGFPFSVLIDGDGTVAARWSGEKPIDELESLIASNLTLG